MMNNDELEGIVTKAALRILCTVFGIVCIGCVIIPYVVAHNTGRWEYLLIYPGLLVFFLIVAFLSGRKKKNG